MFGAFIGVWEIIFLLLALVCFVVVVVVMVIGAIFFFKSRPQNTKGNQSPPAAPLPSTPAASTTQIFPAKCPQCGTPLPAGALAGLCPACLLKMGAATDTVTDAKQPPFNPPGVAELAAKFPQLEIIELIGKGGMGAVYKARQKQLDRIVALKILPPGIGHDAAFAERFAREAKALAKLNHPNIVTLYEFGDASGQFYFLMEFVDGVNLRQLLHNRRIAPREALAIVPQICDALQFAHDQGIVHRDIKPENILMDRRGRVKVADFGLAKIVGTERGCPSRSGDENAGAAGLTETLGQGGRAAGGTPALQELTDAGKIMGTPQYMSPEQITAPGEVDHRADIYALGVVFYQMLTGELPGKKIEPPSKKVQIDVRLDEIVLRALEKKPELRYQQVSEVKTCVETIAATPDESRRRGGESQTERPSADESRSQSLLTSSPTKGEPRFSRTAIVGACLCLPFVLSVMVFAFAALSRRATQSNVLANLVLNVTPFLGLFVGLPAILATTILGWMAVSQIRRSAGKLYGLWLAVFDGLLFPLLLLDGVVWVFGGLILMFFHLRMGLSAKLLLFLIPLIAIPVAVILDFLIIRRVWRAVNRPVEGSAPGAPQSKSGAARDIFRQPFEQAFGPRKKPDHFWRWFAVAVFAFISIPVLIAIVGLLAAIAIPNFVKARAQAQANARHAAELVATNHLAAPNLVFGPVMERVIPDSTRELGFALDFETGVLLNPPGNVSLHMLSEGVAFDTDPMNWARKYGGDLVAMPDGGVRFIEGVVSRQANESHLMTWDEFTPERVVADVNRLLTNPMVKMDGAWPQFYTASDRAPLAMAFITREHSQGVIQILGNSDNPPGVKIRYKLVQGLTATESNTPPASAETWSPTLAPGEKPDVSKIWNDAKDLMEQGKYEEALQRHIWYFNHALEYDPGQTGVRLSFALSQWVELGRRYPKAKQAVLEIRDRDAQLLASGEGYAKLFMDVNSINNYLGQEDATLALFKTMYENDPKLAGECFYYAEDLLLKNGEYELLFKCVGDPQAHFESARRGFEVLIESQQRMAEMRKKYPAPQLPAGAFRPPDMMQVATNNFVGQVCKLVEILVATGHNADAEKIQNEAVTVLDDPRLQSAVRDAEETVRNKLAGKGLVVPITGSGSITIPVMERTKQSSPSTSAFQIRLVADDSDTNVSTEVVTNFPDEAQIQRERLRLTKDILLDGKAVERAGWHAANGRTNFVLGLTEAGGQQFETLTATNLKRRIAIIFQGRVLSVPVIQDRISTRSLDFPVNWSRKDLERTMNGLNQMNNPVVNLSFGPEQENVLPPLLGIWTFLNLRDNRLMTNSHPDSESRAFHDWQRDNGADVAAAAEEKIPVLLGYGMATAPAAANGLDNNSPADIWYNWDLMVNEPEARSLLGINPKTAQDTYYFRTRDDTWGILQIVGFTENPRGVKLRYKLVQNGNEPKQTPQTPLSAMQDWLALMDAGAYPQSWDTAADIFHKATTKDAWMKLSGEVRQPLGRLVSRKEISTQSSQTLPGLPRGFYFIAQFETSFAELTNAVETVAVIQKSARQWRIVSYLIRPRTAEQTAAVTAAQKWLAGIDAGNYAASWTDAAESFQGAVTQDKWVSAMESVRKPLGGLQIRTVDSAVTETQMPGAPDGKYVVMQFETAFAKKNSAIETVTFVLEKDGQWKASGYYIK